MTRLFDIRRIRASTPSELRDYYKQLLEEDSIGGITTQLLQAVDRGSIAPLAFAPWLGVSRSPATIREALCQNTSVLVRKFAIKQLRNALFSSRWKETWYGVGGVAGLLDIFSDFSVHEVKEACRAIGRCGKGNDLMEKRQCFTELFEGLYPDYFPDAVHKTKDRRPLARYYRLLIPACSEKLVNEAVAGGLKGGWKQAREKDLLRYHHESMRTELLRTLASEQTQQNIHLSKPENLLTQYPRATSKRQGFSASMEFSLTVLREVAESERCVLDDDFFIDELVRPLLARAIKKHADWDSIREIVDLTMQYLEAHPSTGKEIVAKEGDIHHLVAICWSRSKPELFEKQLRRLLSHPVFGTAKLDEMKDWARFLSTGVAATRRYALLRLCYQESTGLDIDVDADLKKAKGELDKDLLDSIGPEKALLLFTRLRKARGDPELVEGGFGRSVLSLESEFEGHDGDQEIYHIYLLSLNGKCEEAEVLATQYMVSRKKKAISASQPEQRAHYANLALYAGIASGSLDLYKQTLNWTKRFLRDPLVFREVYNNWFPEERKRLLSGIPYAITETLSFTDLRQRVEAANAILADMFDTACEALQEPSFAAKDWRGILGLFYEAIKQRIDLTPRLKRQFQFSDSELYHCLWEPTIPMLVELEARANEEGNERLEANLLPGIIANQHPSSIELDANDRSTYTFLDNLARARDGLWARLRKSAHPAVTTLPEALPRGLPIQYLTAPWSLNVEDLEQYVPYIADRVEATLFPNPTTALQVVPSDGETKSAIGAFVDKYQYALELEVPKACNKEQRRKRFKKVWNWAITLLSQSRMNEEEAIRYWSGILESYVDVKPGTMMTMVKGELVTKTYARKRPESAWWPPQPVIKGMRAHWPLIPSPDESNEPCEWNPFTSGRPDFPARELGEPTYLDLSTAVMSRKDAYSTLKSTLELADPEIPAHEDDPNTVWNTSRDMGEGGVLSALLFLDAKYVSNDRLLAKPFPSAEDARYPSLYLADEFLDQNPRIASRNIRGHIEAVPPALLLQLAQNLIKALDVADPNASAYTTLHEVAIRLVIRLAESDKPALAMQLTIRTILARPKSSSWHRQLLKPSFLRRLSAADARACMETFAGEVIRILRSKKDEGEQSKDGDSQEALADQPYVKVTTIKQLAQLLQETDLVGIDQAVLMLSKLSETEPHVDVRLNLVKGLLKLLEVSSPEHLDNILTLLEPFVAVAGALNEREPLSESDWANSERDHSLPELQVGWKYKWDTESPILAALVTYFLIVQSEVHELQPYVDRIILPVLGHLKQQTARWVALFLRKYAGEDAAEFELLVPPVPRDPKISQKLLSVDDSRLSCLPRAVLEEWVSYITFNIAPPASIRAFNERLEKDHALYAQKDVQAWLELYGEGLDAVETLESFDLISSLGHAPNSTDDTKITHQVIQEQFLKLYTAVLWNDTPTYTNLTTYVCRELLNDTSLRQPWWNPHGRSIIEAMISYVNSIRTREWERDPARTPSILPDLFSWRLRLLDYPFPTRNDKDEDREKKCGVFATQLSAIVNELSGSRVCRGKLDQLETYLASDAVSSTADRSPTRQLGKSLRYEKRDPLREALMNNRIITAVYLGDITQTRLSWLTRFDLLKVEVAGMLIGVVGEDWKDVNTDMRGRLKGVLEMWKGCENEEVRRKGWEVEEKYLGKKRDKWGIDWDS
jgi:hypothetical protein